MTGGPPVRRGMTHQRIVTAADVPAFGASAKMKPPSAQSQAFDATCSAWLDRWVDTVPLRLHRLLSDFLLLQLLLIDGRTKGALFDSLDLNGFWFLAWTAGLVPDLVCASQVGVQRCHHLGALADRGGR